MRLSSLFRGFSEIYRRAVASLLVTSPLAAWQSISPVISESRPMFGLIGKFRAVSGQREKLAAILLEATSSMPGCLSYVVASDVADPDALWITEVWESAASHRASLSLPGVQQAIAKGKPLIGGFGERFETKPIGGFGLASK